MSLQLEVYASVVKRCSLGSPDCSGIPIAAWQERDTTLFHRVDEHQLRSPIQLIIKHAVSFLSNEKYCFFNTDRPLSPLPPPLVSLLSPLLALAPLPVQSSPTPLLLARPFLPPNAQSFYSPLLLHASSPPPALSLYRSANFCPLSLLRKPAKTEFSNFAFSIPMGLLEAPNYSFR